MNDQEREVKFALDCEQYWHFIEAERLELPVVRRERELMTNTYYDTPSHALDQASCVLRSRKVAGRDGVEWTFKRRRSVTEGYFVSDEHNALAPSTDLGAELPPLVAARTITGGETLTPLFQSVSDRHSFDIQVPSGILSLSVERVRILGDPVFVDYELEIEDRGAGETALVNVAEQLRRRYGLTPSTLGKKRRIEAYLRGQYGPPRVRRDQAFSVLIPRIRELLAAHPDRPVVVVLSGGSGSGKTYCAELLEKACCELPELHTSSSELAPLRVIHLDDWFGCLPLDQPLSPTNHFDLPAAFDIVGAREGIARLAQGQTIDKPLYSFVTGQRVGYEPCGPARLLLVEGIWGHDRGIPADLRVCIAASAHGQLLRRLMRDVSRTQRSLAGVFSYFCRYTMAGHYRYHEAGWREADLIIVNDYDVRNESARLRGLEHQLKCPVALTVDDLKHAGARQLETRVQRDEYFAPDDLAMSNPREVVRLRHEGGHVYFAYKGYRPFRDSPGRPRWDFEIDPADAPYLATAGYRHLFTLHKVRHVFELEGARLHLDYVWAHDEDGRVQQGRFLDIDSSSAQGILQVRAALDARGVRMRWRAFSYVQWVLGNE